MSFSVGRSSLDDIFDVVVKEKEIHQFLLFKRPSANDKAHHNLFSIVRLTLASAASGSRSDTGAEAVRRRLQAFVSQLVPYVDRETLLGATEQLK